MFYFYIIYSPTKDKFYVGHTSDLGNRIKKHNTNHQGFTGRDNDWELVYSEAYSNKAEAYARERQVKNWKSRKKIIEMISKAGSEHPD